MALKYTVESLDDVPENKRDEYIKEGDVYKLQVDDVVPKKRLDEFRENKKKVDKELLDLQARFKDVDPDKYRRYEEKLKDLDPDELTAELVSLRQQLEESKNTGEKGKQQTKAELEAQIEGLTKKQKKELADLTLKHQADLDGVNGKLAQATAELSKEKIENQINHLAVENSIRSEALMDVTLRASKIFSLEDGKVVATKPDGTKWISDATDKYLTVAEWFKILVKEAPHLFKESSGTGSSGSSGSKGQTTKEGNGENPWKPTTQYPRGNQTQQALIIKRDVELARRMAREAGIRHVQF